MEHLFLMFLDHTQDINLSKREAYLNNI